MSWPVALLVAATGLLFSAFFSGAETGFYCINRVRLHVRAKNNDHRARLMTDLLGDEPAVLCVTLAGTNLMNYLTTVTVAYIFAELLHCSESASELYTVALLTPIVFVFGEVVPKNLFQVHADAMMLRLVGVLVFADRLFRMSGMVWFLKGLVDVVARQVGGAGTVRPVTLVPKRQMAALLREGLAGKDHADDQGELIDRVFHVSETSIATVMVPWGRVRYLLPRTDRAGLSKVARASRHRRMPVWDPRLHRVTGMIDVDALLGVGGWRWVSERMEPMPVVEPTTTVASAIVALQSSPHDFALITGRGERPLGIVTLNGLVNTVLHGLQPDI